MLVISNETGVVYKKEEGYLFYLEDSGFDYALPDHGFDKLKEEFSSAMDLTQKGRVTRLQGSYHYAEKNAYGQTQYEGDATAEDKLAIVAIGTFIDLSDSDFVLINCSDKEFWQRASAILAEEMSKRSGFFHRKERKELEPLAEYARTVSQ